MHDEVMPRFWAKVEKSGGCWTWLGATASGYGRIKIAGKVYGAHRVASENACGDVVPRGLFVCHRCDNRACVRPSHLFLGTPLQNMKDCVAKGRTRDNGVAPPSSIGEMNSAARLRRFHVWAILDLHEFGWSPRDIAGHFPVTSDQIYHIVAGRRWRHIFELSRDTNRYTTVSRGADEAA